MDGTQVVHKYEAGEAAALSEMEEAAVSRLEEINELLFVVFMGQY